MSDREPGEAPEPRVDPELLKSAEHSALGRMVAAIAHEINNPLTAVLGHSQLLLGRQELSADVRQRLALVVDETYRASRIVENLLLAVRHQTPERRPRNLADDVRGVVDLTRRLLEQDGVELVTEIGACPPVWADERQLRQVLLNLVQNAQRRMRGEATRVLTLRVAERDGSAVIDVEDTGPSIPAVALPRLFDPFFTPSPGGTGGIALWVSLSVVEQHGGRLLAANRPGGGAVFTVTLPYRRRRSP